MGKYSHYIGIAARGAFLCVYGALLLVVMALAGCRELTPMPVPPLTTQLGYDIPSVELVGVKWTTVGLTESVVKIENLKLETFSTVASTTINMAERARSQVMDWLTVLGLGGTAGLPLALRKLPAGAVTREEYVKAGKMNPEEFQG